MIDTSRRRLDIRVTCKATHESLYELTVHTAFTVAQLSFVIETHVDAQPLHRVLRGLYMRPSPSAAAHPTDDLSDDSYIQRIAGRNLLERRDALLTAVGIADGAELLADYPSTEAEAIAFLKGSVDALRGEGAGLREDMATIEKQTIRVQTEARSHAIEVSSLRKELAATKDVMEKRVASLSAALSDVRMLVESLEEKSNVKFRSAEANRVVTQSRVDELRDAQASTEREVSRLRSDITNANSEARRAKTDAAYASREMKDVVAAVNKSLDTTKRQMDGMNTKLHNLKRQVVRDVGPLKPRNSDRQVAVVVRNVPDHINADDIADVCMDRNLCNPQESIDYHDSRNGEWVAVIVCNTIAQRDRMIRNEHLLRVPGWNAGMVEIESYEEYFDH